MFIVIINKNIEKRLLNLENNQKLNCEKNDENSKISQLEKQLNVVQNQYQNIAELINTLSKRLDKIENNRSDNESVKNNSDIKTVKNTVDILNKTIPSLKIKFENRMNQINKKIIIIEETNAKLENKIKEDENKFNNLENEINSIESRIDEMKNIKPIQSFSSTLIMSQRSDFITDQDISTQTATLVQSIFFIYIIY